MYRGAYIACARYQAFPLQGRALATPRACAGYSPGVRWLLPGRALAQKWTEYASFCAPAWPARCDEPADIPRWLGKNNASVFFGSLIPLFPSLPYQPTPFFPGPVPTFLAPLLPRSISFPVVFCSSHCSTLPGLLCLTCLYSVSSIPGSSPILLFILPTRERVTR